MGKLNTSYGNYCYQTGTMLDRAVTKYCTSRNDYSESTAGDEASLQLGRLICCRGGVRQMRYDYEDDNLGRVEDMSGRDGTKCDRDELDERHVEAIDESRLAYRAEGNSNIVLALIDDHQVLRLRKTTISCPGGKDTVDLERFVKFSRVIASCFSRRYVPHPKLGRLDTYDLDEFNKKLAKFRPVNRLAKEIQVRDCILYPDVAFLPVTLDPLTFRNQDFGQDTVRGHWQNTYCVEIKPKQGWCLDDLCYGEGLIRDQLFGCWNADQLIDLSSMDKCRFCLFQYSKLRNKMIGKISKYCPLDLFSGKPIRMLNAIKGLIGSPQNNLKLCKNGRIVYDEQQDKSVFNRILKDIFPRDGRTKEERKTVFMNLIKETLLKDFSNYEADHDRKLLTLRKDRKKKDKNLIHQRTCSTINYQFLPRNCALKQILDIQLLVKSTLPKVYSNLYQRDIGSSSASNPFAYIDELYEKYLDYLDEHCGQRSSTDRLDLLDDSYLNEQERYLLGASALDCSIMITFRRLAAREEDRLPAAARTHIVTIERMKFLVNVTIADLDPKSLKHCSKYVRQLQESIVHYREFMSKLRR
ncbi:AAEL004727-PB [Aedes aegypti]|uniref:Inositol-pentakisphosphate 2-kinase n=2 Tax=Aedes aegypti TaxID=7159 RepID=Q17C24_AEDAE|nr:inositol-pentakisphosphate 2-kinase [Aedes aegypti]XP_021702492.1 inositol-pentakisphosphate 2-kinase [Aedes aegypti]EAT43878.1 AAEL004727-PB [Aedes aegypti]